MERSLMNINEESEILSKLGILSSTTQSPMKSSPRKGNEFVDVKVDDWKWETDGLATATDDEQSDEDLIYDKHTLLDERSSSRSHSRKSNGVPCRNVLLASSFLCLGLSSSILGPTLPDIGAATNSSSMISLSYLISFNALGYLLGNVILSRLFTRLSPMMFLMFCVLGTVPSTLLIAWSSSLSVVNFHSCVLGIFLGSIHRGGLIIMYGKGGGVRTLFALHACLALGAFIAPLMSAPFVFNAVRTGALPTSPITIGHSLVKRDAEQLNVMNASEFRLENYDITNSSLTTTKKPERPDHAVGQQSVMEPKSKENEQKRKEVQEKKKQMKMTNEQSVASDCSSTNNASECIEQSQINVSKISGETNETSAGNGDSSEMSSDGLNGIPDDLVTSLPSEDRAGIGIFPTATQTAPVITTARQNTSSTATIATTAATSATTSTASTTPSITPSTDASVEAPVANLIGDTLLSVDERKGATGTKMTGAVVGNGVLVDTFSTTQTGQLDESAMWRIVKQQVAELNDVKLVYATVASLCFCCAIPFVMSFICCCEPLSMVPDLHIAKLRTGPEKNDVAEESAICYWRWLARVFFLLVGGVEMSMGALLTLYILGMFPKQPSQLDGALITSAFWAGVLLARLLCTFSLRLGTSPRLMQLLLLAACAVCAFSFFYPPVNRQAASLQVLLIGILISALAPGVLCWLDAQLTVSRLSSTILYGASLSVGRAVVPYTSVLLMSKYSSPSYLFLVCCINLGIAFVVHLLLTRAVRTVARLNAISELSDTVMANSSSGKARTQIPAQKENRNGKYMALVESDVEMDTLVDADEQGEDEL